MDKDLSHQLSKNSMPNARQNFWEFVDSVVESREELEAFCQRQNLQLLAKIGGGGFGSVYLVKDMLTNEKLALKLLDFAARHPEIYPRFYSRNDQVFCAVEVEISCSIQEILHNQPVAITIDELVPFLVETACSESPAEQTIKHHDLIQMLCREQRQNELVWLREKFVPGIAENWLLEILDSDKLNAMSAAEIFQLAPALTKEMFYEWEHQEWHWRSAANTIFPFRLLMSIGAIIEQGHLLLDGGKSLLQEFFYDPWFPEDPYWRFAWFPHELKQISAGIAGHSFCLNHIWHRYSIREIEARFPGFFELKVKRRLLAGAAMPYLAKEKKQEAQRLLAVKNEVVVANAMRQYHEGFNQVARPPYRVGNNIAIISPFLYPPNFVLDNHFCLEIWEKHDGEKDAIYCLAFPVVIHFLYSLARFLQTSPWNIGDIKVGNFRLDLAGQWQIVDYGGHYPKSLKLVNRHQLLGSNDYASFALFQLLNAAEEMPVAADLISQAGAVNSQWFSVVKAAVRMLSGRGADYLRGADLNQALANDFQGYHENVFMRLLEVVLLRRESPYHYRQFSLVNKDVHGLFAPGKSPGLETALRRLLWFIGLTLTGDCAWSLLDAELKNRLSLRYQEQPATDSTWSVLAENDCLVLVESGRRAPFANRCGMHPRQAEKLLSYLFPGLSDSHARQSKQARYRKQILGKLKQLGQDIYYYFDPPARKYFVNHSKTCLQEISEATWLAPSFLERMRLLNHQQLTAEILLDDEDADTPEPFNANRLQRLRQSLTALLQQRRPELADLDRGIGQLLLWQRYCFNQYLGNPERGYTLDLASAELLFMDYQARLKEALAQRRYELLEHAVQGGWLSAPNESALALLTPLAAACNEEEKAAFFLHRNLVAQKDLPQDFCSRLDNDWHALRKTYRAAIESHPFFPNYLAGKSWTLEILDQFLFSGQCGQWWQHLSPLKRQRLQHLKKIASATAAFPWATLAIAEERLHLLGESLSAVFTQISCQFREAGFTIELSGPQNQEQWEQRLLEARNFLESIRREVEMAEPTAQQFYAAFACGLGRKTDILLATSQSLASSFRYFKKKVGGHFLFANFQDGCPLKFISQKLQKLITLVVQDNDLPELLAKIDYLIREAQQKQNSDDFYRYGQAYALLGEIENTCKRWSVYAGSKRRWIITQRLPAIVEISQQMDERPIVANDFRPDVLGEWQGDRLCNRIARFLSRSDQNFVYGSKEQQAIARLLQGFYKYHGLKLDQKILQEDATAARVYQILKKASRNFNYLPPCLQDLKKIAAAGAGRIDPQDLRDRFYAMLPAEVQAPNFQRSVLLEFLEYKIKMLSTEAEASQKVREKILSKQLQRELQDLERRSQHLQSRYPELALAVENYALLRGEEKAVEELRRESRDKWPIAIRFFEEYLRSTRLVLQQQERSRWQWRGLLQNVEFSVLQRIYPGLRYQELREICFLLFELAPMMPIKQTREFIEKCHNWHLTSVDQRQLRQILQNRDQSSRQVFAAANDYLDRNCWSRAEQQLSETLATIAMAAEDKQQFWQRYLELRRRLPLQRRLKSSNRFCEQLARNNDPDSWPKLCEWELWRNQFLLEIPEAIVDYFTEEFLSIGPESRQEIYDTLHRSSQSDIGNLFNWMFNKYVFLPAIQKLDSSSWFGDSSASDSIITALTAKYLQDTPIDTQFRIARAIKDKLSVGWQRQAVLAHINSII